jgi:S-adenosylmethionine:tRNA ribosyltransferase-isomerase
MPIYGIVISLMCFAVACQAFFFLEITCKNTSVRILEIVSIKREQMMEIYQHAIEQKYRFLSYGDAMLLNKQTKKYNEC